MPRVVFTGGSGKAGRHVIPELIKRGYEVLNIDLVDFPDKEANVFTLKTDLTDSECPNSDTLRTQLSRFCRRTVLQCIDDPFQLRWI